jgi:CRP-like cAMP-binding protein
MISPELLRLHPFFAPFKDDQLKSMAMLGDEINLPPGSEPVKAGRPALALYFLLEGSLDLYYQVEAGGSHANSKVFPVGEINPGEPFGISSLFEPYQYGATVRAPVACRVIQFDAQVLRRLPDQNLPLAYILYHQVAKAALERLAATRVQLAAAWA